MKPQQVLAEMYFEVFWGTWTGFLHTSHEGTICFILAGPNISNRLTKEAQNSCQKDKVHQTTPSSSHATGTASWVKERVEVYYATAVISPSLYLQLYCFQRLEKTSLLNPNSRLSQLFCVYVRVSDAVCTSESSLCIIPWPFISERISEGQRPVLATAASVAVSPFNRGLTAEKPDCSPSLW